jgi:lycopene beta-cyclase
MPKLDCDLLIIGAGCAGLSLAREIIRQSNGNNNRRVMLLEPRENYGNDRTWCFWQRQPEIDRAIVSKSWNAWQFDTKDDAVIHRSATDWAYHCVPAATFYKQAQQDIKKTPSISLLLGQTVTAVNPTDRDIEVETNGGCISASRVIDTRPPTFERTDEAPLKQVFYGLELRLNEPQRDTEIARLMSRMSSDAGGFKFHYLLPLAPDHVLLEVTRFSPVSIVPASLEDEVYKAAQNYFPNGIAETLRHEQGLIPMGLPPAVATADTRWVRAGTSAGAVRASSGYAFQRIQRWARDGAFAFLKQQPIPEQTPVTGVLGWMDRVFLDTLRRQPDLAPDLFMALARHVPADRLVRFLTEQPRAVDLAAVIAALPARPMLKTLSKRRFTSPKLLTGKAFE